MNPYQQFIYKRTYSRWVDELERREEWDESVNRYGLYLKDRVPKPYISQYGRAIEAFRRCEVMPSMRAFWAAGPALDRDNIAAYNCSYLAIRNVRSLAEMLYILMNGTGVGFSVERQYVSQLPVVPQTFIDAPERVIVFADSKRGWAEGFYKYLLCLYRGEIPKYDLSKIRPEGARLVTFGGRASGPGPLQALLDFCRLKITLAAGRRLNSLEVHDICCMIAKIVVVGGVRRSACISLGNLSDERHAKAKSGEFWLAHDYRALANNSVAYTEKPDARKWMSEWMKLIESKCGERGIFNRVAADKTVLSTGRREPGWDWGCNPCGEVILRPEEFCNLTEAVVRSTDSLSDLCKKVEYATILGCIQSTLTDFKFINSNWARNCEEERLLGVSLTGLMDHPKLNGVTNPDGAAPLWLLRMKEVAIETAKVWSKILGIEMPKAITTCKPSGTVSQLVDSSSGIHPRFAPHYIRRVRVNATDPLARLLIEQGVPHAPEVGQDRSRPSTWVFEFPIEAPAGARFAKSISAIEQVRYWWMLKTYWTEHNPSCTVYVDDHEWPRVGAWVYDNWDDVCGITFFPRDNGIYPLAPYEEIDAETYNAITGNFPDIDFSRLSEYEQEDNTEGAKEFACQGGACEL